MPSLVFLRLTWKVNIIIPQWFSQIKKLGLQLINKIPSGEATFIEKIPDAIVNLENLVFFKIWLNVSSNDWLLWLQTLKELELYLSNNQLSVDYPNQTPTEQMILSAKVVEKIENNPSLKQRVTNALKEAGTTAFEEAIDHPAAKVIVAGVKGYFVLL